MGLIDSGKITMAKILITGGTGLVGRHLSSRLHAQGHQVVHLSRSENSQSTYPTYRWDIATGYIDEKAMSGVDYIVHLAGAGVADKRWTDERKQVILDSRTESIRLLYKNVRDQSVQLKAFISASAIGYYGADTGSNLLDEESAAGSDFLAEVVKQWESEADRFKEICPVCKVRIGVVLDADGGAMKEILKPINYYVGAPLGSGKQLMSWIHIDDLVSMFEYVIENQLTGTYNATAPNPVTNEALTKELAGVTGKPLWLPNVPAFVMKVILGEMAQIVLGGSKVSSEKIRKAGFTFKFTQIEDAVKDLIG